MTCPKCHSNRIVKADDYYHYMFQGGRCQICGYMWSKPIIHQGRPIPPERTGKQFERRQKCGNPECTVQIDISNKTGLCATCRGKVHSFLKTEKGELGIPLEVIKGDLRRRVEEKMVRVAA